MVKLLTKLVVEDAALGRRLPVRSCPVCIRARVAAVTVASAVSITLGLAGCAAPVPSMPCMSGDGPGVAIVVSGTRTDRGGPLPPGAIQQLRIEAGREDVTDGPGGTGIPVTVSSADGEISAPVDLTPRRPNCAVEFGQQRKTLIEDNLNRISETITGVTAQRPGLDLVEAMVDAVAGREPGLLFVVSHGLSTAGVFDIRKIGFNADPAHIATQLRDHGLLPTALAGWKIHWIGLGATAGDQPPLPWKIRDILESYWRVGVLEPAGAVSVDFDDTHIDAVPSGATAEMPVIAIPGMGSVTGPNGEFTQTLSDTVLDFAGDSANLSAPAVELIEQIAEQLAGRVRARLEDSPAAAHLVVTGFCADPPGSTSAGLEQLSLARANSTASALEAALVRLGITLSIRAVGSGPAPGTTAIVDGVFVEAIAATMRRVELQLTYQPIY